MCFILIHVIKIIHVFFLSCSLDLQSMPKKVERMIFKEIINFHYMTYVATPKHKNACPGRHEIYTTGRPFLHHGHHYHVLSLPNSRKEDF